MGKVKMVMNFVLNLRHQEVLSVETVIEQQMRLFDVPNDWHGIVVPYWQQQDLTAEWLNDTLDGKYLCCGLYWYFEKENDAVLFKLRWL
jgi:hypothetical protein